MMNNKKIRYAKVPKYALGTKLPKYGMGNKNEGFDGSSTTGGAATGIGIAAAGIGGSYLTDSSYSDDGRVNADSYVGGKTLTDAAAGASMGSVAGPWGTLIGGVVGAGYGAISGSLESSEMNAKADSRDKALLDQKNNLARQKLDAEARQRDIYSRTYINQNPINGQQGASIYAYGTKGGKLKTLASGIEKAEGQTHEQGGIELSEDGKPFAEIEHNEIVVDDDNVLSDRLPFTGKKTFADEGESLGHEKAEHEKNLKNPDIFKRNTAKRNLEKIDNKMNTLLKYQDIVRKNLDLDDSSPVDNKAFGGVLPKYGNGYENMFRQSEDRRTFNTNNDLYNRQKNDNAGRYSPPLAEDDGQSDIVVPGNEQRSFNPSPILEGEDGNNPNFKSNSNSNFNSNLSSNRNKFNSRNIANGVMNAVPYMDNIANARLIKQTPQIPNPIDKVAIDETAIPMQTKYDISGALNENNRDMRTFNNNILNNTANSNDARANLAGGLANKIANNNQLYNQKVNAETQMQNANLMNQQAVNNRNVGNRQEVINQNSGQKDKYNWDNMLRSDDIRTQKSANIQNATNDAIHGVQDKRTGDLDNKRILYDSLKYSDGAGLATLVGTPEMDNLSKTPEGRKQILDTFRKTGQKDAEKKYREIYKIPNNE
jgi:hypothetical protein